MKHFCFFTGLYSRYDVLMFERQGKSLVEAGFKVTYVVCDDEPDVILHGIRIVSTGFVPRSRVERFVNTKKILVDKILSIDADIYQISDPELIGLVKILKRHKKDVVFNLREYYPKLILEKKYIPSVIRKPIAKYYELIMKKFLPLYDAVFVSADWEWEILYNKWGIKRSYVLTNFPRINRDFKLSFEEYSARGNVLGYEGSIYRISRQEKVLDALIDLSNVKYFIAGKFEEGYDDEICQHSYWKNVEFKNGFKLEELRGILAKMSIANVLRDFGTSPGSFGVLKIFESMEAGLPVLLSDVPLYREMNEKWHCGLCINPNDTSSIREAIQFLVNNKKDAYIMGQNGRKAVLEEYNWEKQAERYINIIKNL